MNTLKILLLLVCMQNGLLVVAQFNKDSIVSKFVLYERRQQFNTYLQQQTIAATMNAPLDSTTEDKYTEACWAISQFLIFNSAVENGFQKLFAQYPSLSYDTKRSFLEALFATTTTQYATAILQLAQQETVPKLFAMQAVYLQRAGMNVQHVQLMLAAKFTNYQSHTLLSTLYTYLTDKTNEALPLLTQLFAHQQQLQMPIIYSFQRSNRNYPGLAIIQYSNGKFARNENGQLIAIQQLARSASNLPYFITNGSTPQGAFSIVGTAISNNHFIGPTPNIQLVMPYEDDSLYYHFNTDTSKSTIEKYNQLFPASWANWQGKNEVVAAGKIGRTEIIAHGTTIDPDYFKAQPFYPLTPTLGCLCAKETWNIFNGKIDKSDQFTLANTFAKDPKQKGILYVINLNDAQAAVGLQEVEAFVLAFEKKGGDKN
jgi:hypothetical protein